MSFERRQILTRKKKQAELKEISTAVEIFAYGCKLLSVDKDLLEAFVSAAFCILTVEPQRILRERSGETESSSFNRNLGPSGVDFQLDCGAESSSFSRNLGPSGVVVDLFSDSDESIRSEGD